MKIREIMSRDIVTVTPETTLKELASIIKEKRIHGTPVVNSDGILVGVITITDLLKILQQIVYWSDIERLKPDLGVREALIKEKESATVAKHMSTSVHFVSEDDPIEKALEVMCKHNVHTIPVAEERRLIGVVGASDIIEAFI